MSKRYMDFAPVKQKSTSSRAGVNRVSTTGRAVSVTSSGTRGGASASGMSGMPGASGTRAVMYDARTGVYDTRAGVSRTRMAAGTSEVSSSRAFLVTETPRRATVTRSSASVVTMEKRDKDGLSMRKQVKMGEIEDLNPRFVKTDVPKRPLSDGKSKPRTAKDELTEAKSKRLIGKFRSRSVKQATVAKASGTQKAEKVAGVRGKEAYRVPNSPFINQDKVAKRPLSKNVYQKRVQASAGAVASKPVTVVEKPKKESHVGLVVTIILTIILGAVAGTVAFLLLPK